MINYERMKQITDEAKFMLAMADLKGLVLELNEKHDKLVVDNERLIKQRDELLEALHDAATSLETIQLRSFVADSYMDDKNSVLAYAGSRASVARESIAKAKGSAK